MTYENSPDSELAKQLGAAEGQERILLMWTGREKARGNPQIWRPAILFCGLLSAAIGIGPAISNRDPASLLWGVFTFGITMLVTFLSACVLDLIGGAKFASALTTAGIRNAKGKDPVKIPNFKSVGNVLMFVSDLSTEEGPSAAEWTFFISYGDVIKIKYDRRRKYVIVRRAFGYRPIWLCCTPENFQQVFDILKERCPSAKFVESRFFF